MIGLIDYGAGNLNSLLKAIRFLDYRVQLLSSPEPFPEIDRLIIPGVGSFRPALEELKRKELLPFIREWLEAGKPLLGICLGLQLLSQGSQEAPEIPGLAFFPGSCQKLQAPKVPHIGWNEVKILKDDPVFHGLPEKSYFYFVHSFALTELGSSTLGITDYGTTFSSVIKSGRIYGCQFHPEKSGQLGLKFLKNWVEKC